MVLIKDFGSAKQRLAPALDPLARRELARRNALLALRAAMAADHVVAVAGSEAAAEQARLAGAEVVLEARPEGQNTAAGRGISFARARGAAAVLLLSSDLPLVTREVVRRMLDAARRGPRPAILAAPATGRGGTNALYLEPPDALSLHFGDDSLAKFEAEARSRGIHFALHRSPALALDLDEPDDLRRLSRAS